MPQKVPYRSIAEWNYDIPLCFKLLLSSSPEARSSAIWSADVPIAFVGNYKGGVAALNRFLVRIDFPGAKPLIDEAMAFLNAPDNRRQNFVLEAGEIFDLSTEPMDVQSAALLSYIRDAEVEAERALLSLSQDRPKEPSWFAKVMGSNNAKKGNDPLMPIYKLGLGNWSNVLYYEFSEA